MAAPTIVTIQSALENLPNHLERVNFFWEFLLCFKGTGSLITPAMLSKLQSGHTNLSKDPANEVIAKLKFHLKWSDTPRSTVTSILADNKQMGNKPCMIIAANKDQLSAYDVVTSEWLDIPMNELMDNADFFIPLAGIKKFKVDKQVEVDVKATQRMGKLFDEIRRHNKGFDSHHLNVFLARLLFCYYSEDTGIFKTKNVFTNCIGTYTHADGSDLSDYLIQLFSRLDKQDASEHPDYMQRDFPYVNGSLFAESLPIPQFSKKARRLLIDNGEQDWQKINPDIFGSMFQVVIDPEKRHELGAHYTSRENIMKVIEPLFLNDLHEEFEKARGNEKKLRKLHERIRNIHIFDPACGSGNFLIMAYDKLRELETAIYDALDELSDAVEARLPMIHLDQFFGIEIEDFAKELAVLSMWIKEHQLNLEFNAHFGVQPPILPLRDGAKITHANALREDWDAVCPRSYQERNSKTKVLETIDREIYLLGNPPYIGAKIQSSSQKYDLSLIAEKYQPKKHKNLDFISGWFIKGSEYIGNSKAIKLAFVSTNSICQGEHVTLLWQPIIEQLGKEINFAHTSFKWRNEASNNAGVTCVIVGLSNPSLAQKYIISGQEMNSVNTINGYLKASANFWVSRQNGSISGLPPIVFGSMPRDGGHLIFTKDEYEVAISESPEIRNYIKQYMGAADFINKSPRYALWIEDIQVEKAQSIKVIRDRLQAVANEREKSKAQSTNQAQHTPHRFVQRAHQSGRSIIFPAITSENRKYIPLGFLDGNTVVSNKGYVIYNATPWIFGILSSQMHMCWTVLVAGRMRNDISYGSLYYNNFPCPPITADKKAELEEAVEEILDVRDEYYSQTYGELYNPATMPPDLLEAHQKVDAIVESIYRKKPFKDDAERTQYLVNLYLEMTQTH